jgi:hypothetical protein
MQGNILSFIECQGVIMARMTEEEADALDEYDAQNPPKSDGY